MKEILNYTVQAENAEKIEARIVTMMLEEGWSYNPENGHWTHPDIPNTIIVKG